MFDARELTASELHRLAKELGFSPDQYESGPILDATMESYSALKFAGLPETGPDVDAALAEVNHVGEVLHYAMRYLEKGEKK